MLVKGFNRENVKEFTINNNTNKLHTLIACTDSMLHECLPLMKTE